MTKYQYKSYKFDWLHQWILTKLAKNSKTLYGVSDLNREWSDYDMVSKSKLYRACVRLRDANLVQVHTYHNDNIQNSKEYQLNKQGREYVSEMGNKLSRPPELELARTVSELEERIEKLETKVKYLDSWTESQAEFNGIVHEECDLDIT